MELAIEKYCHIQNNKLFVNNVVIYQQNKENALSFFLTGAYRDLQIRYPKFFKMDNLSKAGLLTAEILLKDTILYSDTPKTKMGIFLNNRSSSLDTDIAYKRTIGKEYFPSPAVFVYTLPNIIMGEIAIKFKIFGENTFFVSEYFDCNLLYTYVKQSFVETGVENALVGWVEYCGNQCRTFLMLVKEVNENSIFEQKFTEETIKNLYNLNT